MQYITGKPRTRQEALARFENQLLDYLQDPGFGNFAVCLKEEEKFIGTANLNFISQTSIRHFGYRVAPAYQGKGLATEIALGLIGYGLESCGLASLSAICIPENKPSEKVMQKAGMEFLGRGFFIDAECLHYRIDSQKWFHKKQQSISFTANKLQA